MYFKKKKTIGGVSRRTGYSWNRIAKALSTHGIIINDTHKKILSLYNSGIGVNEIAKQMHLHTKSVQSYLPRMRPIYGQALSKNAQNIKKCRLKKKNC